MWLALVTRLESREKVSLIPMVSMLFLLIVIVLTIFSFFSAYYAYVRGAEQSSILIYVVTGVLGLMVLFSLANQILRRYKAVKKAHARVVVTVEECESCKFRSIRRFQQGDFIFKKIDKECPRCQSPLVVTAIYRRA